MPKPKGRKTIRTPQKKKGEWKPRFLEVLAECGNIGIACDKAVVVRSTAYLHRNEDPEFAAAWDEAIDTALDRFEAEAARRGKDGVKKPVYQSKELVGYVQEYSDNLLMFYLKAYRPERFRDLNLDKLADEIMRRMGIQESSSERSQGDPEAKSG